MTGSFLFKKLLKPFLPLITIDITKRIFRLHLNSVRLVIFFIPLIYLKQCCTNVVQSQSISNAVISYNAQTGPSFALLGICVVRGG